MAHYWTNINLKKEKPKQQGHISILTLPVPISDEEKKLT